MVIINKFFLYYASPLPHLPLQAPKKWVDYYRKKIGEEKPYVGDMGYYPNQFPKATYAGMISYLDEQVGEIVAKLKEIEKYENTIITPPIDITPHTSTHTSRDNTRRDRSPPSRTLSNCAPRRTRRRRL